MATAAYSGSARFEFTGGTSTSPFLLALPLEVITDWSFSQPDQRFIWRSMDSSGKNVVTVAATNVYVTGVIRRDDQPDELRTFLREAMDGTLSSLVYRPTSGATGTSIAIDAVNGGTSVTLSPSRSGIGWECSVTIVLAASDLSDLV